MGYYDVTSEDIRTDSRAGCRKKASKHHRENAQETILATS